MANHLSSGSGGRSGTCLHGLPGRGLALPARRPDASGQALGDGLARPVEAACAGPGHAGSHLEAKGGAARPAREAQSKVGYAIWAADPRPHLGAKEHLKEGGGGSGRRRDTDKKCSAGKTLAGGRLRLAHPEARLIVDASGSNTETIAIGYADALTKRSSRSVALRMMSTLWALIAFPGQGEAPSLVQSRDGVEKLHSSRPHSCDYDGHRLFPIANMPTPVRWLTYPNPLRYFLVIIRGIFLKGVGAQILWPQMLGLALIGSLALLISTSRFRKRLG